jgi:thioredoxin-like negative regulator of GroEL
MSSSNGNGSANGHKHDGSTPRLVVFHSKRSGHSRRVEGYLSQVLQRRGNHDSFHLRFVEASEHPELVARFLVDEVPTLLVIDGNRVTSRLVTPRGCREIEEALAPWLH